MIQISIRGYRGIERADLRCARIGLVTGSNGAGKTSIVQAVAAALTGQTVPVGGVKKGEAGALVRAGQKGGHVKVSTEAGSVTVSWPKAESRSDGQPPHASPVAAGLLDVLALDDRERVKTLGPYLKAEPTKDDVAAAIRDAGLSDKVADAAWTLIEREGWDGAWKKAKEKGIEFKGAWQRITGETYGSAKAPQWTPKDWSPDLDPVETDEYLRVEVATAKGELERAIAASAVDAAETERLTALAAETETRRTAYDEAAEALVRAATDITAAEAKRRALPPAEDGAGLPCPHCGELLTIVRPDLATTTIEKAPKKTPPAELKKRREAIAAADGEIARLKDAKTKADTAAGEARAALAEAERAAKAVAEAKPAGDAADVPAAREALAKAEARLAAWAAKSAADREHRGVEANARLQEILAPDGLRKTKLARALEAFNGSRMGPLCEAAGWKPVELTPDLTATYGGRQDRLLSASERYRVRATLQVALAQLDGSAMVAIDAADILDPAGRNGLIKLLRSAGLPALVAMTIGKVDQAPDLGKLGLGGTWWIESGIAEQIGLQEAEAA